MEDIQMSTNENSQRSLSWVTGLSVALGVPLLIIPSIEYFARYLLYASVGIWILSVLQGFFQNMAYGEMAVDFPDAAGIPGYSQRIMGNSKSGFLRFLGGFSAWGYWFAWAPIPAIFTFSITNLLLGTLPESLTIPRTPLCFLVGSLVLWGMFFSNRRGLSESAVMGYVMNFLSLAPITIIALLPFFLGKADMSLFSGNLVKTNLSPSLPSAILLLGLFGMAQWSACAWETAAIYGPEYRDPKRDTPKALISCGLVCLILFVLVQVSCLATLGVEEVCNSSASSLLALARVSLGRAGSIAAVAIIIIAMLSIIKTGFCGAAMAMRSMAEEHNLPDFFRKTNAFGIPQNAMLVIIVLNYCLLLMGSESAIVAASSVGYCIANGVCLMSYVKHKYKKHHSENRRQGFSMPGIWLVFACVFAVLNLSLYIIGLLYLNYIEYGWITALVCVLILFAYVPMKILASRKEQTTHDTKSH